MKYLLLIFAAWMMVSGGCSVSSPTSEPGNKLPIAQAKTVEAPTYVLSPLTAATWTARPVTPATQATHATPAMLIDPVSANSESTAASSNGKGQASQAMDKSVLIHAIENASGCKVTDTDVSHDGTQLDAQVDCASSLDN